MKIKYNLDDALRLPDEIKKKIESNYDTAVENTLNKIAKDTDPYVPYSTGKLANSVVTNKVNKTINYPVEYASFAFSDETASGFPKQYNKKIHKLATSNPIDVAENNHSNDWVEYFKEELLKDVE